MNETILIRWSIQEIRRIAIKLAQRQGGNAAGVPDRRAGHDDAEVPAPKIRVPALPGSCASWLLTWRLASSAWSRRSPAPTADRRAARDAAPCRFRRPP